MSYKGFMTIVLFVLTTSIIYIVSKYPVLSLLIGTVSVSVFLAIVDYLDNDYY